MATNKRTPWFQLTPENDVALAITQDTQNRERVTVRPGDELDVILVHFEDYFKPECILSFGRDRNCSIVCDPPGLESVSRRFSRRHCQFFLSNSSLMLRDDSSGASTTLTPRDLDPHAWELSAASGGTPRQRALLEAGEWHLTVGPAEFLLEFTGRGRLVHA
ncbi:hypothetical protein GLAREA_04159 [Glarea lozoyensis ATCC 20868]|uniref:FHA domain-containing protein n=1 Tax=Glarea lozoyensis (strain ATCC 20868 / MF5171) TaxID=1116229 RepID=S3CXX8_GLAL2|nr:uncharacterized protein GLAREA_04159 [Glarea lozoyensis ATCC 20868]EPE31192.1 hypothetical protein GLAREA_04159 [Glarea lozoyensis ATCC 20868]